MSDYALDQYAEDAMRTAGAALDESHGLVLSALGLSGEAGEYADLIKKHVYHDHPLDRDKAAKEIGDVMWYVARAARAIGIPLSDIARMNIAKLRARYPEGFTSERSINRENAPSSVTLIDVLANADPSYRKTNVASRPTPTPSEELGAR